MAVSLQIEIPTFDSLVNRLNLLGIPIVASNGRNMRLSDFIVINRSLTVSERNTIEAALRTETGLVVKVIEGPAP